MFNYYKIYLSNMFNYYKIYLSNMFILQSFFFLLNVYVKLNCV